MNPAGSANQQTALFATKIIAAGAQSIRARGQFNLKQPVVFTNGVFDVLHRGHVCYLEAARQLGGSLIVALNTDASARRLDKGAGRPINTQDDRAHVIAALASVDAVVFFDEDTPYQLIDALRPDIIVKGADYDMSKLAEAKLVESYGGKAIAINFVEGYSTSRLIRKIQAGLS
jgi:D-glycero-beta-D-manno-heptose 1-phosphate adenylyltransferase